MREQNQTPPPPACLGLNYLAVTLRTEEESKSVSHLVNGLRLLYEWYKVQY